MTTDVDICNRALQMAAARSTISALNDGSNEANNCNLLYTPLLRQTLSMARWNFARKTANLTLVRAVPGTLESLASGNITGWVPSFPQPPWLYAYKYPTDCVFFSYLVGQYAPAAMSSGIPIFSTQQFTFDPLLGNIPQRFVVGSMEVPPSAEISGITKANPAVVTTAQDHGFSNGNSIEINNVVGMTEVNNLLFTIAGVTATTFQLVGIDSTNYNTYVGAGSVINLSAAATRGNVVMTNAPGALGTYTMLITDLDLWSDGAVQAFVSALAGFLAIPLSGDKKLAEHLLGVANSHVIQARAEDGNEGLTIQQHQPDWITVRDSSPWPVDSAPYFAPYPSLFAVS